MPVIDFDTPPERILLVALDNLGDLVFTSALTPALREAFPNATIDVWCRAYTAPVAALIPHVTTVIAADPFWAVQRHIDPPSTRAFLRSARQVRANRYDLAVLSEAPWRTAAAVATTRIPVRIGPARNHNAHFLTHTLPPEDPHKPVVSEQARLLTPLGIQSVDPCYALDVARLGTALPEVIDQLPPRFAALHAFASRRNRCVPLAEWTQIAFELQSHGLDVLWVGTPSELRELRGSYAHPSGYYVDQIGDGSLTATAAALSLAALFVGHDSGPLHIAAAFGVPVIGVFAPGQPDRTFPQGAGPSIVIHRPTPAGITSDTIMREIEELGLFSTA
ncbi:MAG: ADP-heptose--lipooligosaccharide heptosyltransferase [Gemmatimonadetes bacterium]|nr:ADP-heptose--lipooligosaccharide heptosyltransferase [Gemmatimonadota bacterium]